MAAVNSLPFPPSAEDGDIVIRDELIGVYHANINTWEVKRLGGPPSLSVSTVDPWVDKAWGTNSVVVWKGRLYAALTPVVAGDPAPDDPANSKWRDVTNPGAKGDKGDQGAPPPVFFVTATQVGNIAKTFPANTLQQNIDVAYRAANPLGPKENEFFVVSTVGSNDDKYAGIFVRKGANWNPAGGGGSGSGGTTAQNFRAATTTAQVPGKSQGDLDIVTEDKNHQLNVFDGSSFVTVFSEQQIKGWIASGSLFQGTLSDDTGLAGLPTPALANKGFYWTWTGTASHSTTVPISATLQVGDWLQSDGVTYVHVPSDLMSKLRWESVGSFRPWIDGSFEQASLVSYNGALYRANSSIVPGDVNPADPAAKWTKLSFTTIDELTNVQVDTPNIADGQILRYSLLDAKWKNVKLNLGDLDKVSANVIDPDVHGAVLQWDDNVNQWVSSDTIQIGAIRFDDVGVGPEITGFADTDFSVTNPSEESSYVPSVYAVKQYISAQPKPFLYELDDCGDLSTATNGQVPSWDATNSKWVPYTVSTALSALTDVDLTTAPPANTQVLKFNGTTSKWEPGLAVSSLVGLTDVTLTGLADLDTLRYDNATAKWVNRPNDAYTKAEVDLKINAVATGMAHEAAVQTVTATPPASPTADLFYIVATGATGAFAGHVNEITYWNGTAWQFATPANGETRLVEDQQNLLHWNGTAWVAVASTAASTGSSAKRGVGEIIPWVGLTVPTDYLPCDGRVVATASYPDLFAVIGNRFKGSSTSDGTTTFTLPDLRGYFLRGIGGTGGAGSIGDVQQDTTRLPRTAFTGIANTAGVHTHTNACGAYMRSDGSPNWNSGRENDGRTSADGDHTHSVTINGGGDSETRPVNIGVQWIIRVSAINGGAKGDKGDKGDSNVTDAMIGDVKESVLTEPQFKSLLSTADQLKWVLADGRDVTGSRYATVTGRNTVPDLRGAYLRMAGQNASNTSWNGGNLNSFQEDNTARPRNSQFTGTTNNNGAHSHTYTDPRRPGRNGGFSGSSWDGYPETARYPGDNTGSTSSDGDHSHTVTITGGGDVETRPKTFTVNYFIKVN